MWRTSEIKCGPARWTGAGASQFAKAARLVMDTVFIFMCICICICVCIVSVFVSTLLSIFVSARLAMDLVYIFTRSVFSCAFVYVLVSGYTGLEQKKASKGSPAENCYIRIILHFCFLCFSRIFVSLLVCWIVGEDDDDNACELPVTGCSFGPSQLTG